MSLDPLAAAPGWFGKLSSLGDFASRRLPPDWVGSCDGWLASGMSASQAQLGPAWQGHYLSAPVWRFAWAPGVIDKAWWFGVLMASCDNVGRYFPLVVAQSRERAPSDRLGLDHLELWWAQVSQAAMQTLQEQASVAEFEADLAGLMPWPSARSAAPLAVASVADRRRIALTAGSGLVDVADVWASQALLGQLSGCSLWWPLVEPGQASALTVAAGLPPAAQFSELLTGSW